MSDGNKNRNGAHYWPAQLADQYTGRYPHVDRWAVEVNVGILNAQTQLSEALTRFRELRGHVAITSNGYALLRTLFLSKEIELSQSEISKQLRVTRGGVTYLVDELESAGFVMRRIDPANRRLTMISLTSAGHTLFDEFAPKNLEFMQRLCEDLSDEDRRAFAGYLRRLSQKAETLYQA